MLFLKIAVTSKNIINLIIRVYIRRSYMQNRVLVQSRTQSNACARARMALALGKLTIGTPKFRGSGFVGMHN